MSKHSNDSNNELANTHTSLKERALELLCISGSTFAVVLVIWLVTSLANCLTGCKLDFRSLVAGIPSAFAAIWVALLAVGNITRELKNTNKTRIAEKRVEWIEDFRENVQTFLSLCSTVFDNDRTRDEQASKQSAMSGAGQDSTSPIQVYREEYKGIRAAESGVRLRLYDMQKSKGINVDECRACMPVNKRLLWSECGKKQREEFFNNLSCPHIKLTSDNDDDVERAEHNLPICMHRMTRIIGLKPGSDGSKAFEKELTFCGEKESLSLEELEKMFSVCYDGIASMTALILKREWERSKTLDGELFD